MSRRATEFERQLCGPNATDFLASTYRLCGGAVQAESRGPRISSAPPALLPSDRSDSTAAEKIGQEWRAHHGRRVSFQLDGKQYIAVQSGWGVDAARMQARLNLERPWEFPEVPQGGSVWVFAVD